MTTKAQVVASYGDPKKPKRWATKRIRREFAAEILAADKEPPEATFDSGEKMLAWLNDESRT